MGGFYVGHVSNVPYAFEHASPSRAVERLTGTLETCPTWHAPIVCLPLLAHNGIQGSSYCYAPRVADVYNRTMIHVLATVEIVPGRREDFLAEFRRVMPAVHQEAGCLEYGPAIDVPTGLAAQAPLRPDVAVIVEKWETLDALKAHLAAPHMAEYRARVKDLVQRVSLQVLQPAS